MSLNSGPPPPRGALPPIMGTNNAPASQPVEYARLAIVCQRDDFSLIATSSVLAIVLVLPRNNSTTWGSRHHTWARQKKMWPKCVASVSGNDKEMISHARMLPIAPGLSSRRLLSRPFACSCLGPRLGRARKAQTLLEANERTNPRRVECGQIKRGEGFAEDGRNYPGGRGEISLARK